MISGSFANNDLQLKASYRSPPPCRNEHLVTLARCYTFFYFNFDSSLLSWLVYFNVQNENVYICLIVELSLKGKEMVEIFTRQTANTLQQTATDCNRLQQTATDCNTLQHTATRCNTLQRTATHCNALQHTATHCNTLQHTATHTAFMSHIRNTFTSQLIKLCNLLIKLCNCVM